MSTRLAQVVCSPAVHAMGTPSVLPHWVTDTGAYSWTVHRDAGMAGSRVSPLPNAQCTARLVLSLRSVILRRFSSCSACLLARWPALRGDASRSVPTRSLHRTIFCILLQSHTIHAHRGRGGAGFGAHWFIRAIHSTFRDCIVVHGKGGGYNTVTFV